AGFVLLRDIGVTDHVPRMVAVEPAAGAPLARALERGADRVEPLAPYRTVARSIAATTATDRSLLTLRGSAGAAVRVGDAEILAAQTWLARQGLFLEPAGAAGLAALTGVAEAMPELDPASARCVVVGTAGGLRQVGALATRLPEPLTVHDPDTLIDLTDFTAPSRT